MPKRSRSGVVSRPARVVAPTSVKGGSSSVTTRAPAPAPTVIGSWRSSIAGEKVSSTARGSRWISSTKKTERGSSAVRKAAMSALRSSAGPAVWTKSTSSPAATIWAREVMPRPGGPASRTWSSASPRAAAAWMATPSWALSASWPTNSSRRRGRRETSSSSSARRPGVWMRSRLSAATPGVRMRSGVIGRPPGRGWRSGSSPRLAQRVRDQVLGRLAGGAVEQLVGLLGGEAEPDQAVACQQPWVVAPRDDDRAVRRRGADLLAQLHDDPLRGALADARNGLEASGVPGRDRGEELTRRAAGEARERDLRADGLDADEQQEEVALGLRGEAVEQQRVVAHDQVGMQDGGLAGGGHLAQRLGRDGEAVAHATAGHHDVVRAAD